MVLFVYFTSIGDEWEDEYASFRPKSSKVHPTNLQSVLLLIMGFEYVNSLPLIHCGPFRPQVGIMPYVVVSDLLIYPFNSRKLTL